MIYKIAINKEQKLLLLQKGDNCMWRNEEKYI